MDIVKNNLYFLNAKETFMLVLSKLRNKICCVTNIRYKLIICECQSSFCVDA